MLAAGLAISCPAQQYREAHREQVPPRQAAVERHFQSKHPWPQPGPDRTVPGTRLLDAASARASQLKTRILAARAAQPRAPVRSAATGTTTFPGLQFRGAIPTGSIPAAVVTGDFNRDGHMDFIVANGDTSDLWIYLGKGDGTFELPRIIPLTEGLSPVNLATADLRKNGILDLIVAEFDTSTVGVLLGNGDGTFGFEQTYSLPQPPVAVVVDDFNHDGKPDIAAVMFTLNSDTTGVDYIAALLGDGTGSFASPVITQNPGFYSTAWNIASGDVNGDGLPDLLITGPGIENSQVYFNAGDGTFTPGPVVLGNGTFTLLLDGRFADVNEDGCPDAVIADAFSFVWVFAGDCNGHFRQLAMLQMGDSNSGVRVVDLNGDGHLDIVTTAIPALDPTYGDNGGNTLSVALGDGHGNFSLARDYVGTGPSYSLAIADFNGDGKPDVVTSNTQTDTASVYLNDGSGGFGFPQGLFIGLPGVGVINAPISPPSYADLNGDGKPDVVLLDVGYNGEYFVVGMLNDGTGRFSGPIISDTGINVVTNRMGDYRLGDFRNTGHLDFVGIGLSEAYTVGVEYILFMPGNGDGTFGKPVFTPTPAADGEMAIGDFNRDGKLDFVVVGPGSGGGKALTVFLGNGDGTFHNAGSLAFTDGAADIARVFAGDFNRDGKLDVLVYDTGNGYWTTASYVWEFLGNGDGTFRPGRQLFSAFQPMTLADVNRDGWPDILRYDFFWPDGTTQNFGPARFTTYLGQPDGSFQQSSSYAPYAGVPLGVEPYLQFGDPAATSMVSDLNGDGMLDAIAFQSASGISGETYAQILMGNGDGTFTPTYDVFAFDKDYFYPQYAHDMDGDGIGDLLEVVVGTSSMHVFKGGPAPALQLVLEEAQLTGNSGCGWVFPNVGAGSDRAVTLSSSQPGVNLPGSVTVAAGSLAQQFCYTVDPAYDWHQVFDVRAQLGSDVAVAYASLSYVVGFAETLSPATEQVIYPGQSTNPVNVTLTAAPGYSSTAQLYCEGLPAGATCSFGSATLQVSPAAPATTTVVVNTSNPAYSRGSVTVVADDGQVAQRQSFIVTVQPLSVSVSSANIPVTSPGSAVFDLFILGIPPYTASCSGQPPGVTCSFSGDQLPYPSSTSLAVTVSVPSGLAVGSYPLTLTVNSGPATASVTVTLSLPDFTVLPPSAAADWAPPGGTVQAIVSIQPVNGFSGMVNITCSMDFGGTCTGGPLGVIGLSEVPLSISVPAGTALGSHTLNVTATAGALVHTYAFPFYVADYSGSVSTSSVSMPAGGTAMLTATVSATTGFAGAVVFNCTGASVIACVFSPPGLQLTAGNPQTVNLTLTASLTASARPAHGRSKTGLLGLAVLFPIGIVLGMGGCSRRLVVRLVAGWLLLMVLGACASCGGGGNGGSPPGGVNAYVITVNATANGTGTTRTLGTVNVSVTH